MAAKLQCYHVWLFYYLYSADYKLIKAVFKLKFAFVKVLFAKDFCVIFKQEPHHSQKVKARKQSAFDMLKKIYFPDEAKQHLDRQHQYNNTHGRTVSR